MICGKQCQLMMSMSVSAETTYDLCGALEKESLDTICDILERKKRFGLRRAVELPCWLQRRAGLRGRNDTPSACAAGYLGEEELPGRGGSSNV